MEERRCSQWIFQTNDSTWLKHYAHFTNIHERTSANMTNRNLSVWMMYWAWMQETSTNKCSRAETTLFYSWSVFGQNIKKFTFLNADIRPFLIFVPVWPWLHSHLSNDACSCIFILICIYSWIFIKCGPNLTRLYSCGLNSLDWLPKLSALVQCSLTHERILCNLLASTYMLNLVYKCSSPTLQRILRRHWIPQI